ELTNPALVFMADSKFVGYGANEQRYRAADLVKPTFGSVVVASGGGDKTAELLTTVGYSARKIRPQAAIVSIGSNDVRLGVSSAT
ncbi:hypothetical protein, partial [Pseudomonas syringae]|uniref:hypothetical protein n=1 Tax=Pseudomonas syringae TaxID=317 RepID=UPI0034D972B2